MYIICACIQIMIRILLNTKADLMFDRMVHVMVYVMLDHICKGCVVSKDNADTQMSISWLH